MEIIVEKKPSKYFIIIPTIVFVLCLIIGLGLIQMNKNVVKAPQMEFVVPCSQEVNFEAKGDYTIYLQLDTQIDGKTYTAPEGLEGLSCKLFKGDEEISIYTTDVQYNYNREGKCGSSYYEFNIKEPGTYRIETELIDAPVEEAAIGIGKKINMGMMMIKGLTAALALLIGVCQFIGFVGYAIIAGMLYKRKHLAAK